jgi:hypothetical protein
LKFDDSDEILVSVAWCHDEEKRRVEMFPEYLSFDTTFGLNRLRRSLFLAVGTDGYNKVFVISCTGLLLLRPNDVRKIHKTEQCLAIAANPTELNGNHCIMASPSVDMLQFEIDR